MKKMLFGSAVALAFTAAAAGASAQTTPAPGDRGVALPELVVTAQRREETAQTVGVALTVLSSAELVQRGVTTVNDIQYSTPNLQVVPAFGGGQPQFRLRGVGFDDYASNNTSTVGVYVNEVAYPFPVQTQGVIFDVARVEVLRGPQGTLYGRNTTGGAVNFITNKPTPTFTAGLTGEYGRFDQTKVDGYVSGPITDTLRFRLAGTTQQGGAWQTNRVTGQSLGDKDRWAVRGMLAWAPAANVDVLLDAHYSRDKSEAQGLYLFQPLAFTPGFPVIPADTDTSRTGWVGSSLFTTFTGVAPDAKPFRDNTAKGVDGTLNVDLGGAKLTSITAFERFDRHEYNDWDASVRAYAGTYFATHAKVFSQEVRLASDSAPDAPLTWLVGAYYSREDLHEQFASDFAESLGLDADTRYQQHVRNLSGFGQAEYRFAPKLKVIAGLRVETEKRSLADFITNGVLAPGAPPLAFISPTDVSKRNTEWSGKLALNYTPTDTSLIYASISRGVKSGGFTAYNTLNSSALEPFQPEVLLAYEAGFKSELLDRTVRLNGAMFYYDYKKQQVQSAIFVPGTGAIGKINNADAHIWGAELEALWRPTSAVQISQALGYQEGKFTNYRDLDITASVAANAPVFVQRKGEGEGIPKFSYQGSASYTWDLDGYDLQAEGNYAYHGKLRPVLLGPVYNVDAYWLVNANLSLTPTDGNWQVAFWGRNIFNEHYDLTRNFFLTGISIAAPGEPATYGVRVSVHY